MNTERQTARPAPPLQPHGEAGMTASTPPRLGASTWTYLQACDVRSAMRRLGAVGLRRFDVLTVPPHLWPYDLPHARRRDLRQWLEAEDFVIESLNLPSTDQNLCSATEQMRAYSIDQWRAVFDLCSDLGVGGVVMVPGRRPNFLPAPAGQYDAWLRAVRD